MAASHPEMADPQTQHLLDRAELVYQDGLCINPEAQQQQAANEEQQPGGGSQILEYLSHWDFCNPAKLGKRKSGSSRRSKEGRERSARDPRSRFTSRIPFHKKMDLVEDLSWHLDHTHIMDPSHHGGGHHHMSHHTQHAGRSSERMPNSDVSSSGGGTGSAGGCNPPSMGPPGSVKNEREASALGTSINSPASLGTPVSVMTPKGPAPGSVRTPGDPPSLSLMSPHQPASNGPLTPMDTSGSSDQKPPRTPKSVPPPSYSVASPYTSIKSVERKPTDGVIKQEEFSSAVAPDTSCTDATDAKPENLHHPGPSVPGNSLFTASTSENDKQDPSSSLPLVLPHKRPALPDKEYEGDLKREDFLSDNVYDTKPMGHWLNHPVKRFRPANERGKLIDRPMYRRGSQESVFVFRQGATDEPKEGHSSASGSDSRQQSCNGITSDVKQESPMVGTVEIKSEKKSSDHERISNGGSGLDDPYEFRDGVVNGRDDQVLERNKYSVELFCNTLFFVSAIGRRLFRFADSQGTETQLCRS